MVKRKHSKQLDKYHYILITKLVRGGSTVDCHKSRKYAKKPITSDRSTNPGGTDEAAKNEHKSIICQPP